MEQNYLQKYYPFGWDEGEDAEEKVVECCKMNNCDNVDIY